MAPMGKFKKNLNCYNSGCIQDRVVIFDPGGVLVDGLFKGII